MPNRSTAVKRHESHGAASGRSAARPTAVPSAAGVSSGFDRLIYERVRLGIMSALATSDQLTFNELKSLFNASDGNLGAHARKLEEAGYVSCEKYFEGRMPKTEYRLTLPGRRALERYLDHMEAIIQATREG